MSDQFNFEGPSDKDQQKEKDRQREIILNKILYEWPEEVRNAQYKLLVGQAPKAGMSDEHIADGILDPEKEQLRIIAENREEDQRDAASPWRK